MGDKKKSKPMNIPIARNHRNPSPVNEEKAHQTTSSIDLSLLSRKMDELSIEEPLKRRSRSAPLTLEASSVASKLRQLSDSFQSTYEKRNKRRRATVGVGQLKDKRRSWPVWNPQIEEEKEDGEVFQYSSSLPSSAGTSV